MLGTMFRTMFSRKNSMTFHNRKHEKYWFKFFWQIPYCNNYLHFYVPCLKAGGIVLPSVRPFASNKLKTFGWNVPITIATPLAEQPPSDCRASSLGGRSVGARWSLGRELVRPLLAERSWGLVVYPSTTVLKGEGHLELRIKATWKWAKNIVVYFLMMSFFSLGKPTKPNVILWGETLQKRSGITQSGGVVSKLP